MRFYAKYSIFFLSLVLFWGCASYVRYSSDIIHEDDDVVSAGIFSMGAVSGPAPEEMMKFRGMASYYADRFHGRKTASGELYDKKELTAAHRTFPFGTKVKVTNLANGNSVIVTITDRGPQKASRIIDVSRAAAELLDMIRDGVVEVEISVVEE